MECMSIVVVLGGRLWIRNSIQGEQGVTLADRARFGSQVTATHFENIPSLPRLSKDLTSWSGSLFLRRSLIYPSITNRILSLKYSPQEFCDCSCRTRYASMRLLAVINPLLSHFRSTLLDELI
jgi:hypothetical protein